MATFDNPTDNSNADLQTDIVTTEDEDVKSTTTTNSYVTLATYKTGGYHSINIIPTVTGANAADIKILVCGNSVRGESDPDNLTFIDHTEVTAIASTDIPTSNATTFFINDGVKAIRIQGKSNVTDSASSLTVTTSLEK